uniref:sodium- and chloride-dependent GABA transporter 2-like n=1 Tax=Ciona intestinalis TaxID=7719 RepID=UPI00089DBB06|nr:sodium- and chloride-dependent GABA transporter 2-like [Ciona intestinalis]|eukprot:XP_018667410.1 sodium- and chloride-dependent GABA transporter 2-like [Ciona intestinalis]
MGVRQTWGRRFDFFLSIAGMTIGLGNIWRFPYLCYKNGGGVFLIPYILSVIVIGFPLFFLEASFGQYVGQGMTKAWSMIPVMKGIGIANLMITWYSNSVYGVVLAWACHYFFSSFSSVLPWTTCSNTWNTDNCVELVQTSVNLTAQNVTTLVESGSDDLELVLKSSVPSAIEFWEHQVLEKSSGIDFLGGIRWQIFFYLVGIWVIAYVCIFKGIKWSTKVVYVTATLPLVMLLVVLVRGVTLDGAAEGIRFYLSPNMTRLADAQVWMDAVTQVYYSYGIGSGALVTLASYNKFNHNVYRDSIMVALVNSGTSFISGFAVFSTLGFMAKQQNITMDAVAESGPGLVFIVYPQALAMIPHSHFWSALFFLMIIVLGFDCLFVFQECLVVSIMDVFPWWYKKKWGREIIQGIFALLIVAMATTMVTKGGIYVFVLMVDYASGGWCLFFIGTCEFIGLAWVYGADKYYEHVTDMLSNFKAPWIKYCWKFFGPGASMSILIYWLTLYKPLTYKSYTYPLWAQVLGWCLGLSSCLWIPFIGILRFVQSNGSLSQRCTWTLASKLNRQPEDSKLCVIKLSVHDKIAEEKMTEQL